MTNADNNPIQPMAAIRDKAAVDAYEEFRKATLQRFNAPLKELQVWSVLAVACALGTMILLILTFFKIVAQWNDVRVDVQAVSAMTSIVTTAITALIYTQLKDAREELKESRMELSEEFHKASDLFFKDWMKKNPSTITYANDDDDYQVGQFVRHDGEGWEDHSLRKDQTYLYRYKFVSLNDDRLVLKATDPGREDGLVEIYLEQKQIFWKDSHERKYLYRILHIS
jgi:hypothetical protein